MTLPTMFRPPYKISHILAAFVTGALVAFALLGPGGEFWSSIPKAMNNNDGVASWVQAVGSIAALLVIAIVARVESGRARLALEASNTSQKAAWAEDDRRANLRRAAARRYTLEVAKGAVERVELFYAVVKDHESSLLRIDAAWGRDLVFMKEQLSNVPKFLVEDPDLIAPVMRLALLVADVHDGMAALHTWAELNHKDIEGERKAARSTLETLATRLTMMQEWLDDIKKAAGPSAASAG